MQDHESIKAAVREAMREAGWDNKTGSTLAEMAKNYQLMTGGGRVLGKVVVGVSVIVGIMVGVIEFLKALKAIK